MLVGLVHTNATLADVRSALVAMRADVVKIVPAWWPHGAQSLADLPPPVLRTSWGDPSYAGGSRAYPDADGIIAEMGPYLAVRPNAWIEIGNEPSNHGLSAERYAASLKASIAAIRRTFPQARIIGPAMSPEAPDRGAWLAALAPALRLCDALAIHVYHERHVESEIGLLHQHIGVMPTWATEAGFPEPMHEIERAERMAALVRQLPTVGTLFYHLDHSPLPPMDQQGSIHFRLTLPTLQAFGAIRKAEESRMDHWPNVQVPGFAMDVRRWATVAAFRAHLARHRPAANVAPWAQGLTLHHTVSPTPQTWRGVDSIKAMATYYRQTLGWSVGPHLFVVGNPARPADAGIWQMTPLNLRGIHAASFNTTHWGLEMVGTFDANPVPADTMALAAGATAALLDWRGLATSSVNAHRDDPRTDKTCPGVAVDMPTFRRAVAALREG
jgi:hypothetical protein